MNPETRAVVDHLRDVIVGLDQVVGAVRENRPSPTVIEPRFDVPQAPPAPPTPLTIAVTPPQVVEVRAPDVKVAPPPPASVYVNAPVTIVREPWSYELRVTERDADGNILAARITPIAA